MAKEGQARRGRPPLLESAKFRELPVEWKAKIDHSNPEAVNAEIVQVTKNEKLNQLEKKESQIVKDAKEAYDATVAGYKEATKQNKLKIDYMLVALKNAGKM